MITFSNRQINGRQTFDATRLVAAADLPTGDEVIIMEITPEAADNLDPTKSFRFAVYVATPNNFWQEIMGASWKGGPDNAGTLPIRRWTAARDLIGKQVRGEIETLGGRMRLSGSVLIRLRQGDEI